MNLVDLWLLLVVVAGVLLVTGLASRAWAASIDRRRRAQRIRTTSKRKRRT